LCRGKAPRSAEEQKMVKHFKVEVINFVEGAGRIELRITDDTNTILFDGVVYHGKINTIVSALVNNFANNKPHKYETIMVKQ
jgi:hypothetical protein